ncbi:hypothetical protein DPMN_060223 [Dreissena polymorpha]|uniref:Uncharacterized protein n=1 Tax=Dreissena polymorpha TaxID=45954 RepID=A0A9D4C5G7_DREPO|nr:hypothetical protein DPMN_060223 [Dreissena polymorpha]
MQAYRKTNDIILSVRRVAKVNSRLCKPDDLGTGLIVRFSESFQRVPVYQE